MPDAVEGVPLKEKGLKPRVGGAGGLIGDPYVECRDGAITS